jgi:Fur family transcriptional regulator, ferric uptake regulator
MNAKEPQLRMIRTRGACADRVGGTGRTPDRRTEEEEMTLAHHSPPVRAPTLAAALGALRARGLRVSTARRLALEALYAADGPMSADELAARLPGADLASVYRNLDVLEEIGLVRHVHLGHGPGLYSLAAPEDLEFITCERCGAFEAVDPARLDPARALIERELGYRAHFTHFPIVGRCAACLSSPEEEGSTHAHP